VSAVGACHGWNLDAHIQTINSNNIEILAIDTDQVPHSTIIWNFFVKTFLSNIRTRHAYTYNEFWLIDRKINQDVITNDIRLAELKSHINQIKDIKKQTISVPSTVPYKKLLYKELFQKGGSYYLTKQLNINVESRYHQIWDCLLPVANAPDELTVLGHTWRKQDYFNS
jgi:hypothetical protein